MLQAGQGNCTMKPRGAFEEWQEGQVARPGRRKGRDTREGAASVRWCRAWSANDLH